MDGWMDGWTDGWSCGIQESRVKNNKVFRIKNIFVTSDREGLVDQDTKTIS